MKIRFNKILTLTFSLVLAASIMSPAFAAEESTNQTSPVKLTAQPIVFNVGIPTGLPVDVNAQGEVTVATDAKIENHSAAPITITGVQVNPIVDWSIVTMNKDFKSSKIGTKEFGFVLNSDEVPANGGVALTKANWPSINGGSNLPLTYDSIVAPQKDAINSNKIADVVFTIGWDAVEAEVPTEPEIKYVLATDADFSGTTDGTFQYIGTDEYVEIPHIIKGVPVTSYSYMFKNTSIKGVKSTNSNVTNMEGMFCESQTTSLDLSSFDTSNVTNMMGMFYLSEATTLDLSNFDTSKVTNMSGMFNCSYATTLDFSSFNTSKVTDMQNMFYFSQATTLDLSSFDTSNVTDMMCMFKNSQATVLDLSSFNTANVTYMSDMFYGSQATVLDLSNFKTANVTNMNDMFNDSQATSLDLSSFDTSKVTNMGDMFSYSQATTLDLSSFNTANVTDMSNMFAYSQATSLDLSSFDTSKVTNIVSMFQESQATVLDLSSFNTSKVTDMNNMFNGSQATNLDLSSFDTSNVTNMINMFYKSKTTTGYAKTQTDTDKFNATSNKPSTLTFVVK